MDNTEWPEIETVMTEVCYFIASECKILAYHDENTILSSTLIIKRFVLFSKNEAVTIIRIIYD